VLWSALELASHSELRFARDKAAGVHRGDRKRGGVAAGDGARGKRNYR